jgi:dTDP-4-dehydrorhamnose 3,5-epimerase
MLRPMSLEAGELPAGVGLWPLLPHFDDRGVLIELWREEWRHDPAPTQWNAVRSDARVLRGVHVHVEHHDYLTLPMGRATIGLRDIRRESPTTGATAVIRLDGDVPEALTIPPGVAHGFYFHEPSLNCYAVSKTFDPSDELGCRFDDPDLAIPWPEHDVVLSPRDQHLPSLAVLVEQLEPHQERLFAQPAHPG